MLMALHAIDELLQWQLKHRLHNLLHLKLPILQCINYTTSVAGYKWPTKGAKNKARRKVHYIHLPDAQHTDLVDAAISCYQALQREKLQSLQQEAACWQKSLRLIPYAQAESTQANPQGGGTQQPGQII